MKFKFYINVFKKLSFPNSMMDMVHIWYDDRYWSKVLFSTIPTPACGLKIKVVELQLLH